MRHARFVPFAAAVVLAAACGQPGPAPRTTATSAAAATARTPTVAATVTAVPQSPNPRVGAIFLGGQSLHTCSASVVHSTTADLILTAAHCLAGGMEGWFVPAFVDSAAPQEFWHVDAVYLDPRWMATQDPRADFAVARVSRTDDASVESSVGGGLALGSSPDAGTDVAVTGYGLGVGGSPVGCTARVAMDRGYPEIRCAGLVDGTSGSPWLAGSTVVGVTGGLDGGGCDETVSYTPPFGDAVVDLLRRAEAAGPADDAPSAFVDGC
ncbi:trypsin-like peptidase domain-containing protein [Mycobacterium yunnanensis]|uniref:Trypsin-like peptidase domain-containing protein n=2 Tax=Mycobacterium yunnanensis TaxID=368477 RepID=A0A9X3BV00_9MYCO|nr:trypsin-like peptidase domain-containing protein [Mycobacterium yunnanensis]